MPILATEPRTPATTSVSVFAQQSRDLLIIFGEDRELMMACARFSAVARVLGYLAHLPDGFIWSPREAIRLKNRVMGRPESDKPVGTVWEWELARIDLPGFAESERETDSVFCKTESVQKEIKHGL